MIGWFFFYSIYTVMGYFNEFESVATQGGVDVNCP